MSHASPLQELLAVTSDAVAICDRAGTVQEWNHAAESLYSLKRSDAIGEHITKAQLWMEPEAFDSAVAAIEDGVSWEGETLQLRQNGLEMSVALQIRVVTQQGEPLLLVVSQDLTRQRQDDDEILRSQRIDTLGNLVAGISHDLKNVLTPILLAASLLESSLDDEDDLEVLETLRRSANRGVNMVQQLLWFYKGGAERSVLDPRNILRELRQMMKESFPKSIEVRVMTPVDLEPILGNPTQIYQMLLNLCVNARDAMSDGGRLSVRVDDVMHEIEGVRRPCVHFAVEDTGCGIPLENQERVYDLLYSTKGETGGSGVGLATVSHIVDDHGGRITLTSDDGKGTRFDVYIPAASGTPVHEPCDAETSSTPGTGQTVLIVEDEPALRMMTKEALLTHGYRALVAAHGREALEIFNEQQDDIDLVLTDLNMPIMDGKATIQALRQIDPGVSILAVSALPVEVRERQIDDRIPFLRKPYEVHELLRSIAETLEHQSDPTAAPVYVTD